MAPEIAADVGTQESLTRHNEVDTLRVSASLGTEPLIRRLRQAAPAKTVAARLAKERYPFFLDSSARDGQLGRYSFAGCDPFLVPRSKGRSVHLGDATGWRETTADPLRCLTNLLLQYCLPGASGPVPFLGYDVGRLIEHLPTRASDDQPNLPGSWFGFYDALIAYDHLEQAAYLIATGLPQPQGNPRTARAQRRIAWLEHLALEAKAPSQSGPSPQAPLAALRSNFSRDAYLRSVESAANTSSPGTSTK